MDHAPHEAERLEPNSYYAVAKASATHFCRFAAESRRVRIPTLRLYSVYGPWEDPTRLVPTLLVRGLEGRLPPLVHPAVARDFIFVDDAVEAYLSAAATPLKDPGSVLNVGTGDQTTLRQIVAATRSLLDVREEPVWESMPDRDWDTDVWVADNSKIRQTLGWRPRHTLEQGLRKMADWLRRNAKIGRFYADRLRSSA